MLSSKQLWCAKFWRESSFDLLGHLILTGGEVTLGQAGRMSATLQAVENYLAELTYLTTAQNENAYVNPTAIVQDLQQAVIGEVNEDQLGT